MFDFKMTPTKVHTLRSVCLFVVQKDYNFQFSFICKCISEELISPQIYGIYLSGKTFIEQRSIGADNHI